MASTVVLLTLGLITGILVFVGGGFADDLLGFIGLGPHGGEDLEHRPLAGRPDGGDARLLLHLLHHPRRATAIVAVGDAGRGRRRAAVAARVLGLLDLHLEVADVGAIYGTFAGAIVLVFWMWLTNVSLLFGAELNAEIERQKELRDGVAARDTLNRPARTG